MKHPRIARNYDRAAWFYETSAHWFSLGQIKASKNAQLKLMKAGDRVLYLGAGAGEDALAACRLGANVTCLDVSQKMLDRLQARLENEQLDARLLCQNALDFQERSAFDFCAANYFLNVFRQTEMEAMLRHAASLVRHGGQLMIADVAPPQGNRVSRLFNAVYLKSAMAGFSALGLVPWHENYHYPSYFARAGLEHQATTFFRFAGCGPIVFQNIVATRIQA